MKLIWLFSEYHALKDTVAAQEKSLENLVSQTLQLTKDNTALTEALLRAQQDIQSNPTYMNGVMDMLQKYQEKALQELPFLPDQQPEWLTHE
jgi:septal ring factor EnvC (AmiA/AmiB activator)